MDDQTRLVPPTRPDPPTERQQTGSQHALSGEQHFASKPGVIQPRGPRPMNSSLIAHDFHKRLRGKPTHAAVTRSWYAGLCSTAAMFLKLLVIVILMFVFLLGGFGGGMLVGYVSTTEPLTMSGWTATDKIQTSFVYDSEGNEIAKLTGSENVDRIYVSFGDVKDTYIDEAIVAIEDERYYEHNGIDLQRIGSAVLSALANGGTASHGGSTITQQTVKMYSGQDQVSAQRKVQEWFRAMDMEQDYTKDEIMDFYINLAPMGNNYVGIQSAAQNYFGKDAEDLNLTECAFLAGIPKSPSYYNPLRETGKRNALRRMRVVLQKMHELGKITDEEYEEALNTELIIKSTSTYTSVSVKSYFVEYAVSEVIADLQKERNLSHDMAATAVYNFGYRIYTTMEPEVQAALDTTFRTQSLFQSDPESIEDYPEKPEGGMVVINVETGAIAGMQGGYGEKTVNFGTNRAVDIERQPGSSIKPLIVYAPALEMGILSPATQINDAELHQDDDHPDLVWPKNSDGKYEGLITIRKAIVKSKNTVAVQVWKQVQSQGGDMALWFLSQVGIDRMTEIYPATAVGGFNVGMSPLEMAAAYATFANEGVYRVPYAYTKVVDSSGDVILENIPEEHRVYSVETAFLISDILKGVITGGTAYGKVYPITNEAGESIDVAGKTGTTDDNVDKWFCGYTPYYAAATWYGYDNRLRKTEIPKGDDRNSAMYIWNDAMQKIHATLPAASFIRPETVVYKTICSQTQMLATDSCKDKGFAVTDYFDTNKSIPTLTCPGHEPITPVPTVAPPPL